MCCTRLLQWCLPWKHCPTPVTSVACAQAITSKDGQALAHNILAFSEDKTCPDPAGFTSELKSLFDSLDLDTIKVRAATAQHILLRLS